MVFKKPLTLVGALLAVLCYLGFNTYHIKPHERILVASGGKVRVLQPGYALVMWPFETSVTRYNNSRAYETSPVVLTKDLHDLVLKAHIRVSFSDNQLIQVYQYGTWPPLSARLDNALTATASELSLGEIIETERSLALMEVGINKTVSPYVARIDDIIISIGLTRATNEYINNVVRQHKQRTEANLNLEVFDKLGELLNKHPEFKDFLEFFLNILFPPPEQYYEETPHQSDQQSLSPGYPI